MQYQILGDMQLPSKPIAAVGEEGPVNCLYTFETPAAGWQQEKFETKIVWDFESIKNLFSEEANKLVVS